MPYFRHITTAGKVCGPTHPNARLSEEAVAAIAELHEGGMSYSQIGKAVGCTAGYVGKVVRGAARNQPAMLIRTTKPPPRLRDVDLRHAALTALELEVLLELRAAGWGVDRLAAHFDLTSEEVTAVVRVNDPHDDLAPRRVCTEPLPVLPARDELEDDGARALRLVAHALSQ